MNPAWMDPMYRTDEPETDEAAPVAAGPLGDTPDFSGWRVLQDSQNPGRQIVIDAEGNVIPSSDPRYSQFAATKQYHVPPGQDWYIRSTPGGGESAMMGLVEAMYNQVSNPIGTGAPQYNPQMLESMFGNFQGIYDDQLGDLRTKIGDLSDRVTKLPQEMSKAEAAQKEADDRNLQRRLRLQAIRTRDRMGDKWGKYRDGTLFEMKDGYGIKSGNTMKLVGGPLPDANIRYDYGAPGTQMSRFMNSLFGR